MGFFKNLFNRNTEQSDLVSFEQTVSEDVLYENKPEPTPEPIIYIQKFINGSWQNVENVTDGEHRKVTVEHNGVTTIEGLNGS